jgi:hypothetical protein
MVAVVGAQVEAVDPAQIAQLAALREAPSTGPFEIASSPASTATGGRRCPGGRLPARIARRNHREICW